jgi:hypothetical protein
MPYHFCDQCGEPVQQLFPHCYRVPAVAGSASAYQRVWLCRDCRLVNNSPAMSCLMFIAGTLLVLLSVPTVVGLLLALAALLTQ